MASFWGGQASTIALLFFAPVMAKWAFNFGAQEKFLMAAFGLTIIASLSTKSILKGLMMGCVGLLLACVGMDPVMGPGSIHLRHHLSHGRPDHGSLRSSACSVYLKCSAP